jgi:DHA1 family bicyclomycin/chloramphenicol resistance-like MFS transporter
MPANYARNAIVLGLLAAIGPFAIDMYLPALPAISADLQASTAAVQLTLASFFVGFGASQLAYGPVTDMVGRKPPLYFGLSLYVLGSIGCGLSPSIGWLVFFRLLQGIGAASVMVVPRAVIRDLHTGVEATRLMALVMLVLSVSPILAPLIGGQVIHLFGWRSVFVPVTVAAGLALVLVATLLPETWPREKRVRIAFSALLSGFRHAPA